ncbi:hypothetical protein [Brazilian marseillevirus]|uniref:hypothetical protein n=1 Tax=Brazilian marseillevirus TaxID=1813599 RepID=UPI0007815E78|nr:hypothetical protein A3303_gp252 [Brazilian marseillevirus]AMQ10760.1 hypothetical protein [Brazilian marseillevirus]
MAKFASQNSGVSSDAKVQRMRHSKVLLVALSANGIFVRNEGHSHLSLSHENVMPKLLGSDSLFGFSFILVLFVELLEFRSIDIIETGSLIGAEETPLTVFLHSFHEEVRGPDGIENLSGSHQVISSGFSGINKVKNVHMPTRKEKGSTSLPPSCLVNIAKDGIRGSKERNNSGRFTNVSNV